MTQLDPVTLANLAATYTTIPFYTLNDGQQTTGIDYLHTWDDLPGIQTEAALAADPLDNF